MAAKYLAFVLVICIGIAAASARANMGAAAAEPVAAELEGFSILSCVSCIGDATKCMTDVFKQVIAPHPSCCDAIAKLKDCSSSLFKEISPFDWTVIKDLCALWGVTISEIKN